MAKLPINVPFETDQTNVTVDVDPQQPLSRGRHRFQLEVVDDAGNVSMPDLLDVIVADRERPTAVLTGPSVVDVGKSFELSGARSFDIGGTVKTYRFTYLGPALG